MPLTQNERLNVIEEIANVQAEIAEAAMLIALDPPPLVTIAFKLREVKQLSEKLLKSYLKDATD